MPPNTTDGGDEMLSAALDRLEMSKVNEDEEGHQGQQSTIPNSSSFRRTESSGSILRHSASSSSFRKSVSFAQLPPEAKQTDSPKQQQEENSDDYWKRNDSCVELYQEMYWDADGNQTSAAKQEVYNAAVNKNKDAAAAAAASADNGSPDSPTATSASSGSSTASISRSNSNVSLPPDSDSYWKRNDSTPSLYREIYWDQDDEVNEKEAAEEAAKQQQQKPPASQGEAPTPAAQESGEGSDANAAAGMMKRNESEFTLSGYDIEAEEEEGGNKPTIVVQTESNSNVIHLASSTSSKALGGEDDAATAVSSSTDYWKRNDSNVSMYKQIYWDEEE